MAKDQHIAESRVALRRHIVLVGLMGAGKSAIGKRVAARIGARFRDADTEIEKAAGMSIPDIFAVHGEAEFRTGERRVIARLLGGPPMVMATGGGAYMDDETRALLKRDATTIWMRAELDVLVRRCAKRNNRPLLRNGNPREILAALIEKRHPVYAEADIVIDSRDEPHEFSVGAIVAALTARGDLS
jgi:shikimate kinase